MANVTYAENSCLVKTPPFIVIGGKIYTTVKIGGVELMMSNVDNIGVENTDYQTYTYNGTEYRIYKCDDSTLTLLRNNIDNFDSSGWEFFAPGHYNQMFSAMAGTSQEKSLKFMGYLNENWPGTNELGTMFFPWGPHDTGSRGYFCKNSTSGHPYLNYYNSVLNYSGNYSVISWAPLRLARYL